MLKVTGVSKRFKLRSGGLFGSGHGEVVAVDDVSFEVAQGETSRPRRRERLR